MSHRTDGPRSESHHLRLSTSTFACSTGWISTSDLWVMSPVASCRLFRLEPFHAVVFGLRVAEFRSVPPTSAWFVCKWFAPRQANRARPSTPPLILRQAEGETHLIQRD
jgi:hypothetical protein